MKYLKILLIAVITVISFGSAKAQVVVRARVGPRVHRHYYHHRPVHHRHYYWRHHHRYYR